MVSYYTVLLYNLSSHLYPYIHVIILIINFLFHSLSFLGRQALATLIGSRSPAHAHRTQAIPPQPSTAASDEAAGPFPPISNSSLLLAQVLLTASALKY